MTEFVMYTGTIKLCPLDVYVCQFLMYERISFNVLHYKLLSFRNAIHLNEIHLITNRAAYNLENASTLKVIRLQRSGIDTIKYHTWPRIPMGKWQTHRRHHKREPRVSPFPAGDHKAHINRRAQNIANTRQNKNIKDPQKKYRLGTVSKIFYWRA